jgi:DnaB-like helicase C terminal domain
MKSNRKTRLKQQPGTRLEPQIPDGDVHHPQDTPETGAAPASRTQAELDGRQSPPRKPPRLLPRKAPDLDWMDELTDCLPEPFRPGSVVDAFCEYSTTVPKTKGRQNLRSWLELMWHQMKRFAIDEGLVSDYAPGDLRMRFKYVELLKGVHPACVRFSLAIHAGVDVSEALRDKAFDEYAKQYRRMKSLAGPLIHPCLLQVDDHRYRNNMNRDAAEDLSVFVRNFIAPKSTGPTGIPTGFESLDQALGGLHGVTLLAGEIGAGKTTMAVNLARNVLVRDKGAGVVLFSLEESKNSIYSKLISLESKLSIDDLRRNLNGHSSGGQAADASLRLKQSVLPRLLVVDKIDRFAGRDQLSRIWVTIAKFLKGKGLTSLVVMIDRIQILEVDPQIVGCSGDDPDYHVPTGLQADDFRLRFLRDLHDKTRKAGLLKTAVLGLSNVTKGEHRKRLAIEHIPGSAEIVFAANCVLLLEQDKEKKPEPGITPTLLNVAKVRDGGERSDLQFDFYWKVNKFTEAQDRSRPRRQGNAATETASAVPVSRFGGK